MIGGLGQFGLGNVVFGGKEGMAHDEYKWASDGRCTGWRDFGSGLSDFACGNACWAVEMEEDSP